MVFQLYPVQHPALQPYVQSLWYIDEVVPYRREKILPTGTIELIINFGAPFRVIDKIQSERFTMSHRSWLVGMQTEYIINEITGNSHMLGIRFKPGGIAPFFSYPASDFHNEIIELDTLWGRFADELREQLFEIATIPTKIRCVEQTLLKRLHIDEYAYLPIQFAVQQITRSQGALSIKTLSDSMGYSQKHLGNQFRRLVGITPKMLARVFRFQHVLEQIQPARDVNWVDIALACHYHDQSHFNKEFAAFTGLTPSDYMDLRMKYFVGSGDDNSGHFVPIG